MKTVFYDGLCGLCRREIAYYMNIAPQGQFRWVDVTADASELEALGVSYADGLKLLHVVNSSGHLYKGVDAFIQIWSDMKYWRYLAKIVGSVLILPLANGAYNMFADWRFRRLKHCQIAALKAE